MAQTRKVVDTLGIMIDRDSLTMQDLQAFVAKNKDVKGVLELNQSLSDHEYKTWEYVVYEGEHEV